MISAIILAAGESKRMGQTKQLMKWQGKPLLQHVIENLRDSLVNEIILVLGHEAELIQKEIPASGIKIVLNANYQQGMSSSVKKGIMALDTKTDGFMVVLGDQPAIPGEMINQLIIEFESVRPEKNILIPTFRRSRGHPVLFSRKYILEAKNLKGDLGLRQILLSHPDDIWTLEVGTDAILKDIDTPNDLAEYEKRSLPEESA
jgi:molybdenum cofactor cytidylyltransferase